MKGMILQERDRKILKFAYTFRVVTFSQIQRRYFAKAFRTVAPRRIRQLVDAGYLNSFTVGEGAEVYKFVRLSEKGWREIREGWPYEIDNPLFKSESPIHDLGIAELAFSFEKLSTFKGLITENLLQSSSALADDEKFKALAKLQADGALLLAPPNEPLYVYGVEYEISRKNPERYREKLLNYYMASGIDGVLYVSDSQVVLDALARADSEIRSKRRSILHMALEKDVLSSNGKIHFHRADGGAIALF